MTDLKWLEPLPSHYLKNVETSPEAKYSMKESVELAFLVALQILPPSQRAVLILRDVMAWRSKEVAELLDMTESAVNGVLNRARINVDKNTKTPSDSIDTKSLDTNEKMLLDDYVVAWCSGDVNELTRLLKEDATFSMPPLSTWYLGRSDISIFLKGIHAQHEQGIWEHKLIGANDQKAVALYKRKPSSNSFEAFGLQILAISDSQISSITTFMDIRLFEKFSLPDVL